MRNWYAISYASDPNNSTTVPTKGAALAFLAAKSGISDVRDLDLHDRSSSDGSLLEYEVTAQRWPSGETFDVGSIGEELELPPGAVERAVERARAEGVLPPAEVG